MNAGRRSGRSGRPRQADIARLAGVSQATVSLVLGDKAEGAALSAETRRRVLRVADDLGYTADPAARRLVARHNRLLGVHTFMAAFPVDWRNSYYPFLVGVEEEAAAHGYDMLLFTGTGTGTGTGAGAEGAGARGPVPVERPAGEGESGEAVPDAGGATGGEYGPGEPYEPARMGAAGLNRLRMADGCVLLGRHSPAEGLERLLDDGFPLVYVGRNDSLGARLPYVGADYVRASADVVGRLVRQGHRRLLYVREPDEAPASLDREEGFRRGLAESGAAGDVVRTDGTGLDGRWLRRQLADGFTALVAEATDTQGAIAALRRCAASADLSAPRDFSLAMFGEEVHPAAREPELAGFAVPRREMGRRAARMLIRVLTDGPQAGAQELLPCPHVEGETTGPPPPEPAGSETAG